MATLPSKEAIEVALLDLGECLEVNNVNLQSLADKLNSLQSTFTFKIVAPITSARIGNPSIENAGNIWYEFEQVFPLLRSHDRFAEYSYMIGITHLNMTERDGDSGATWGDYFSLSDKERVAIISVNQSVLKYNSPSKNVYQYLAFLIVGELLILLCKKNLIHAKHNFCLFDDCVDRSVLAPSMEIRKICEECLRELKRCNISDKVIQDVFRVLKWCKGKSLKYTAKATIFNPITTLSIGTVLGWFASTFAGPTYYPAVLFVLLAPILVFVYIQYLSR